MYHRSGIHRTCVAIAFFACLIGLSFGLSCPSGGDTLNPTMPYVNRSPRVMITNVSSTQTAPQPGDQITIAYSGEDMEDAFVVRVFASTSANPRPAQEIPIMDGQSHPAGTYNGTAVWDTTGMATGFYNVFAEIDDRTYDPTTGTGNRAVRTTYGSMIELSVPGTAPLTNPPKLNFLIPQVNLGLSSDDEVTTRYIYSDTDSPVRVTLLLDKDLNPTNDDINNPGDPLDPSSKIIILPSAEALPTDPGYEGIRTNPRDLMATTSTDPLVRIEYRFTIDFQQIPVRAQPYYLRATISDESNTIHTYAEGSITISALAEGTVDVGDLGFMLAGARFHGFSEGENLGSSFMPLRDLDSDGVEDFLVAGRFASPRNRYQSGAGYLLFGRRKTPFPPDTNGNGIPDVTLEDGTVVDFPTPPAYVPNPYASGSVGRFGGENSINSVTNYFRGAIYGMPKAHGARSAPASLVDPNDTIHSTAHTAGLTSITTCDMNLDGTRDMVFGVPFVSEAIDYVDYDPVDGGCTDNTYSFDDEPGASHCTPSTDDLNEDLQWGQDRGAGVINQGLVIMVSGQTNINPATEYNFSSFVDAGIAGQYDPDQRRTLDDEGQMLGREDIPPGMRMRGPWFGETWSKLIEVPEGSSDCCVEHSGPGCDDATCEAAVCTIPAMDYCCASDGPGWDLACAAVSRFFCGDLCPFLEETNYTSTSEFGRTVAAMPDLYSPELFDIGLLVSTPGFDPFTMKEGADGWAAAADVDRGRVTFWGRSNFLAPAHYGADGVFSLPAYQPCEAGACLGDPSTCCRAHVPLPNNSDILGEEPGDQFGFGAPAGDFNQDGTADIMAGAPGADRDGLVDCGVVYVLLVPVSGFGNVDLARVGFPRVEIIGTHVNDRFGAKQTGIADISMDTIPDIAFAAELYDGPAGVDSGYVGVIFGARPITGELGFSTDQVGTSVLPGIRFYGASPGARAGHDIASAGDFNGDGVADLLISSPGEIRYVDGQPRKGVAYLIFGGIHLVNYSAAADTHFSLLQVGSPELPGIVFISRFPLGSADEAPLDMVGGIGDADADGFDDIILGATLADFVDPYAPSQRRLDAGEVYVVYGSNHGTNKLP